MSNEVRLDTTPSRIECLDGDGSEIIPARMITVALECSRLLEPELRSITRTYQPLVERLKTSMQGIGIIHNAAYYGRASEENAEGMQGWIKNMEVATSDRRKHGREGIGDMTEAMFRLSPQELGFISQLLEAREGQLIDEDFVITGGVSPTLDSRDSRVRQSFEWLPGQHSRLRENTRKNLQELVYVQQAYTTLLVIEGHELLAAAIGQGVVRGTEVQQERSYELLDELKEIATDEGMTPTDQLNAQSSLWRKVKRFTDDLSGTDPELGRRPFGVPVPEAVSSLREIAREDCHSANTLNMSIYGRAFRLNGNTHLPDASSVAEFFHLSSLSQEPAGADSGQHEGSSIERYADKVRHYLAHISIKQPRTLSAKEVKQRQLSGARAALVRGEQGHDGAEVVKGRSKQEALKYVSDLEFLLDFINRTGNLSAAKEQMQQAASDARQTAGLIDALVNNPGGERNTYLLEHLGIEVPEVKSIEDLTEAVKEDWETTEYLIREYWPGGLQKSEQLRQLLFLSSEDIEKLEAA